MVYCLELCSDVSCFVLLIYCIACENSCNFVGSCNSRIPLLYQEDTILVHEMNFACGLRFLSYKHTFSVYDLLRSRSSVVSWWGRTGWQQLGLIVSMLQSILWVIYRTRVGSASMKAVCLQGQDAWISGWAVGLMLAFLWKSTTLPLSPALRALKILLACFKQQKHELRCVDNPAVCYHVLSVSVSTWGRAQWLSFFKQHNFLWYRQQHGQKDSMIPIFLEQALEEWSAWFDNVDKSEHTCCDVQ